MKVLRGFDYKVAKRTINSVYFGMLSTKVDISGCVWYVRCVMIDEHERYEHKEADVVISFLYS